VRSEAKSPAKAPFVAKLIVGLTPYTYPEKHFGETEVRYRNSDT